MLLIIEGVGRSTKSLVMLAGGEDGGQCDLKMSI